MNWLSALRAQVDVQATLILTWTDFSSMEYITTYGVAQGKIAQKVRQYTFYHCSLTHGAFNGTLEWLTEIFNTLPEVGTRNFFLSPQSQLRNLKEALLQSQFRNFLKKCWSATATPQFHNRNFFWSPQFKSATWELQFCNFWYIFGRGIRSIDGEKIGGKKSRATVPLRQVFGFQRNRGF
jgi:hypothetical protein